MLIMGMLRQGLTLKMDKEYTYEEYQKQPDHIKSWAKKISVEDGRPAHPEDYVEYALELLDKAKGDQIIASVLLNRVMLLADHSECHTDGMYSFMDFWGYIIKGWR